MSFEPITIIVPGVPIGKGRPRFTRTGHAYTPEKTRHYEAMLRDMARVAMGGCDPIECPVFVSLLAVFPVPSSWSRRKAADAKWCATRPDADNIVKLTDALNGIIWRDDNQVVQVDIAKIYGKQPRLEIWIGDPDALVEVSAPIRRMVLAAARQMV